MKYRTVRELANDLKGKIDDYISKDITRAQLVAFIEDLMSVPENRKRIYKVDGIAVTIDTVLAARMPLFREILDDLEKKRHV